MSPPPWPASALMPPQSDANESRARAAGKWRLPSTLKPSDVRSIPSEIAFTSLID